jgi:hypothetical protein
LNLQGQNLLRYVAPASNKMEPPVGASPTFHVYRTRPHDGAWRLKVFPMAQRKLWLPDCKTPLLEVSTGTHTLALLAVCRELQAAAPLKLVAFAARYRCTTDASVCALHFQAVK